jgi:predicted DNA-binding transcriptional regulator AlpA
MHNYLILKKIFYDPITPKYLRARNAAEYLGIGLSTLWKWVGSGRIAPGVKLSARCTVWPVEALETVLANAKAADLPQFNIARYSRKNARTSESGVQSNG